MKLVAYVCAGLLLTACSAEQKTAFSEHANHFKRNVNQLGTGIREAFTFHEEPEYETAIPARYCYATYTKPICYDTPQTGNVGKLVGYQGPKPLSREFDHSITDDEMIDGATIQAAPAASIESNDIMPYSETESNIPEGRPFGDAVIVNEPAAVNIGESGASSDPQTTRGPAALLPRM